MRLFKKKPSSPPLPVLGRMDRERLARPGDPGPIPPPEIERMRADPVIRAATSVKRRGVIAAPWSLVGESERCDFVADAFERMEGSPLTVVDGALDALWRGMSVGELEWREEDGALRIHAVRPRDPSRFGLRLDGGGRTEGLTYAPPEGGATQELPSERFLIWRYEPGYDAPRGRSDLEAARPHYRAKTELMEAWKLHLSRFGSPTMVGSFDETTAEDDVRRTFEALVGLDRHKALVHPKSMEVRAIGTDRDGSQGFLEAIEFHNREIARSILGQTLATDEGRRTGSLALGKVHFQVMLLMLAALRREVADAVMTEGIVRPMVEANFGPGSVPRFEFREPPLAAFWVGSGEL